MVRIVAAALLLAVGYTLGASGSVPELWRQLQGGSPEPAAQAAPAPIPCQCPPAEPASPDVEYSYKRPPAGQLVTARVLSITDGDTFRALIGSKNVPIRMADYDSPERDQPFGSEATEELRRLLAVGGVVHLEDRGSGGFGRTAARVFVGDVDVNFEMVMRGAGWFDPEYAKDEELYLVESAARDGKVGLWALPLERRVEPWVWRGMSKELKAQRR